MSVEERFSIRVDVVLPVTPGSESGMEVLSAIVLGAFGHQEVTVTRFAVDREAAE